MTLSSELAREFDEKCKDILTYLITQNVYENNKKRFNKLFRDLKLVFNMSKPTFNDHLQHLVDKKIVTCFEQSKQAHYYYLNPKHPMINAINYSEISRSRKEIVEELELVAEKINEVDLFKALPLRISLYFTVSELRRAKYLVKNALNPAKARVNLLAVYAQNLFEDQLIMMLVHSVELARAKPDKERLLSQILGSIDKAIEETQRLFREQSPFNEIYKFKDSTEA